MNNADRVALGFIGVVTGTLAVLAGITISEQQKEIARLKKSRDLYKGAALLALRLQSGENVKDEAYDFIVENTNIPNDISKLK